jgi:hypothetical protein
MSSAITIISTIQMNVEFVISKNFT